MPPRLNSAGDLLSTVEHEYVFAVRYRDDGEERYRSGTITSHSINRSDDHVGMIKFCPLGADSPLRLAFEEICGVEAIGLADVSKEHLDSAVVATYEALREDPERVSECDIETAIRFAQEGRVDAKPAFRVAVNMPSSVLIESDTLLEQVFALLRAEEDTFGVLLMANINTLADEQPELIEPYVNELRELLTASMYETMATKCLTILARNDTTPVIDAVPALVAAAETADMDSDQHAWAIYGFSAIANEHPESLVPAVDVLITALDAEDDSTRMNALSTLGRIASYYPGVAVPAVDSLKQFLVSDEPKVRQNAVGLLGDVAAEHPDAVIEYAEELAAAMTAPAAQTRINASIALLEAGGADPQAVAETREHLIVALDDSHPKVRANACVLIGNAGIGDAEQQLRALRHDDSSETVRERASWALQQIN